MTGSTGWAPTVVDIVGRFATASNMTLLGRTRSGERVVYKPMGGERPLFDFPSGSLAAREVLTFRLAETMGLRCVPETTLGGGPLGSGAVQRFVEVVDDVDPLALVREADEALWPVAVLDVLVNNADRKIGHLLPTAGGIMAIDHGLTFHPEPKLRTVLWGFAGRTIPAVLGPAVGRAAAAVAGDLGDEVEERLGTNERDALALRIDRLLATGRHPAPPQDRPAVPWPPY